MSPRGARNGRNAEQRSVDERELARREREERRAAREGREPQALPPLPTEPHEPGLASDLPREPEPEPEPGLESDLPLGHEPVASEPAPAAEPPPESIFVWPSELRSKPDPPLVDDPVLVEPAAAVVAAEPPPESIFVWPSTPQSEPGPTPAPEAQPEPAAIFAAEPEPVLEREPMAAPTPEPEPERALEPEPTPASMHPPEPEPARAPMHPPEPEPTPAPMHPPEPELEREPVVEPTYAPERELEADHEHQPVVEPTYVLAPEPTLQPEPIYEYDPVFDPESQRTSSVATTPDGEDRWARSDPATEEAPVVIHDHDEPVGVKRVAASAITGSMGAEGPPRKRPRKRGVPKHRRGSRKIIPLVLLALVGAIGFFLFRLFEPGADAGQGRLAVKVPPGSSAQQIGDLLDAKGVIDSSFFFSLRARLDGGNLRSGDVALRKEMSYEAALSELKKAPPPVPVVAKVTLPEGPSRKELAARVKQAGLRGSYIAASRRSAVLDPRDYGAPKSATLEGFLFPATYELKPRSRAKALVTQQVRAFKRAFAKVDLATAKRRKLSRYDVLIIASMIEREAGVAKDRRLISGVIYNRLEQGIPLGIDATIRFELENFSSPLKVSELERDTPYNTRTRGGLPPGPIGNPGLASLKAAANPAKNSFIYYVVKPCANGAHAFSSSNAEFNADVAAYNAKRDELGGKDPSRC